MPELAPGFRSVIPPERNGNLTAGFLRVSPLPNSLQFFDNPMIMMSLGYEGQLIVNFLKTAPAVFFSEREIARKAGQKRQFRDNPDWAKPLLLRLASESIIQTDAFGHYR